MSRHLSFFLWVWVLGCVPVVSGCGDDGGDGMSDGDAGDAGVSEDGAVVMPPDASMTADGSEPDDGGDPPDKPDATVEACEDIDCGAGDCVALGSSVRCDCPDGYDEREGDELGCTDIDECESDNGGCDPLVGCDNEPGGHSCGECPDGYTGTGETGCVLEPSPFGSLSISEAPRYDFGTQAVGAAKSKTFTVGNDGLMDATLGPMTSGALGLEPPFSLTGGTCESSFVLAPNESCTLIITFAPSVEGEHDDTIEIGYSDSVEPQTESLPITGEGAAPASLSISDGPSHDFGTRATGSTTSHTFTVTNGGGVEAELPELSSAGLGLEPPFSLTGGSCQSGGSVAASGGRCTLRVSFSPSTADDFDDSIELAYDNGVTEALVSRAVSGEGSQAANIVLSNGPTLAFGTLAIGATSVLELTVTNLGQVPGTLGTLTSTALGLSAPFTFVGGTCASGLELLPTESCTLELRFSPTEAGSASDTLQLGYTDGAMSRMSSRALSGSAAAPASLTISGGPELDFGARPTGSVTDRTLTVENTGGVTAMLGMVSSSGVGLAAPFALTGTGTCATTGSVAPSSTCTLIVRFSPGSEAEASDRVELEYHDGVTDRSVGRDVAGEGVARGSLTISDGPTYDYGTIASGSNRTHTFTVENVGGSDATLATVTSGGLGLAAPYSLTGGSCETDAELEPEETCTLEVRFAPSGTGLRQDTIVLGYDDGVEDQSVERALSGTGATAGTLVISGGPTYAFGTLADGATAETTLEVENTGGVAAELGTVSTSGLALAAPFTLTGGSCATDDSLAPDEICTLVIRFAPTATGTFSDTINLAYDDGATSRTATRALSGSGAAPALLTISNGATFNYGQVVTGESESQTFNVNNTGGVPAILDTVSDMGLGLAAPFALTGGTCVTGGSVAPGNGCTLIVAFSPAMATTSNDTIALDYHDGLEDQTSSRAITGTGIGPARASITISDGATYDYGTRANGSSTAHTFTLQNNGAATATLGTISTAGLSLGAPFTRTGGSCSTDQNLGVGSSCTVIVTFAPTSNGLLQDTIELNYEDAVGDLSASRAIQGTGAARASLAVSDGGLYNFGTLAVGATASHEFTVTNSGGVTAELGTISTGGLGLSAPFSLVSGGTCVTGFDLPAGESCTLTIRFAPTSTGERNDTLALDYDDGAGPEVAERDLRGTGASVASLAISDGPTYDYGPQAIGTSTPHTFVVTNSGGVPAVLDAVSDSGLGLATPFSLTGGTCTTGGSVPANGSCTLIVTYSPALSVTRTDTISLGYHNGFESRTATRAIEGTGATNALLEISHGPEHDYGTRANGSSTAHTFTVTNNGGLPAELATVSTGGLGLGAPFTHTGGSCATGGNVNAGASCTLEVTFAPSTSGLRTDTIALGYDDGVGSVSATRDVRGTGAAPASLSITGGPTYDYGDRATGSTTSNTFTVTNDGGVPGVLATVSSAGLGLAAPFSLTGGSCASSQSLDAGASCTLIVAFAPTSAGDASDTIALGYNNGVMSTTENRAIEGTGIAPAELTISHGATYDFGTVPVGGSAQHTFTVENEGDAAAVLSTVNDTGLGLAAPFSLTGGSCTSSQTLSAGATCTLTVTYTPAMSVVAMDTIALGYNDGAGMQTANRAITGTGASAATLTLSDSPSYDYGDVTVGDSAEHSFTVTNTGGVSATLATVSSAGLGLAAPYSRTDGTCSSDQSLAPNATCTLIVTFSPTAEGASSDSIALSYNNGVASTSVSRDVLGDGIAPAQLSISQGPTYDFGTVPIGGSGMRSFTVTNDGDTSATLGTVSDAGLSLAAPYARTGGSCASSQTLAPAATCTLIVTFTPTSGGTHNDSIALGYDDGASMQTATRALTGQGAMVALLTISDATTYNYGDVTVGNSESHSFTVTNTGGISATLGTVSNAGLSLAAPYALDGGTCSSGQELAPLATCTLIVEFTPASAGGASDSIVLEYENGLSTQSVTRPLTGTGVLAAAITISDGPSYDYGAVTLGDSASHSFTVTNGGGVSATLGDVDDDALSLAAPYSLTGGTCSSGEVLSPDESCTLIVAFTPIDLGEAEDGIELDFDNGVSNATATRELSGTGLPPATLAISEAPTFDYGSVEVGSFVEHTFTVTAMDATAVLDTVSEGALSLAAPYSLEGGTCMSGLELEADESCTLVVAFTPTAEGDAMDSITLGFHDGAEDNTTACAVTGTGLDADESDAGIE